MQLLGGLQRVDLDAGDLHRAVLAGVDTQSARQLAGLKKRLGKLEGKVGAGEGGNGLIIGHKTGLLSKLQFFSAQRMGKKACLYAGGECFVHRDAKSWE